jgi:hypothetical protein
MLQKDLQPDLSFYGSNTDKGVGGQDDQKRVWKTMR